MNIVTVKYTVVVFLALTQHVPYLWTYSLSLSYPKISPMCTTDLVNGLFEQVDKMWRRFSKDASRNLDSFPALICWNSLLLPVLHSDHLLAKAGDETNLKKCCHNCNAPLHLYHINFVVLLIPELANSLECLAALGCTIVTVLQSFFWS